jgi:hypothetical protein
MALQADGWWLRQDVIWSKPNPMPESVTDRCTKAHEYVFLLAKSERYYYDAEAIREVAVSDHDSGNGFAGRQGGAEHLPMTGGTGTKEPWTRKSRDNFRRGSGKYADEGTSTPGQNGQHRAGEEESSYPLGVRNKRSVWTVTTKAYKGAHFATFPPKLIEPMILAGTSAKGCCARCGAPWVRVVEKTRTFESGSGRAGNLPSGKNGSDLQGGGETVDIRRGPCIATETMGWKPGCGCGEKEGIVPPVVLDPFGGSGTVGEVANGLGRAAVLIEIGEHYLPLLRERAEMPLFAGKVESCLLRVDRSGGDAEAPERMDGRVGSGDPGLKPGANVLNPAGVQEDPS